MILSNQKHSTAFKKNTKMFAGFSLPELITYAGLAGLVGLFMWSMMNSFTKKQHNISELNQIVLDKNITISRLNYLLARSEKIPEVYTGDSIVFEKDSFDFSNEDGKCLDFNQVINDNYTPQSIWLASKSGAVDGPQSIFYGENIGCDTNSPSSLKQISDPIYIKKISDRDWFITDNETVQFNLKPQGKIIGKTYSSIDLDINASQTVINYNKIQDVGCQFASPNQGWFENISDNMYRYGFIVFSNNYNNSQDRLSLKGVNCSGNNSTTIDGISVNCLFCHDGSTSEKCVDGDVQSSGFLHLDTGEGNATTNQWENIIKNLEYVPRCIEGDGCSAPIIIDPNSEIESQRLITILLSTDSNIQRHDLNIGTNQGSFLLNLYRLSQACDHENF